MPLTQQEMREYYGTPITLCCGTNVYWWVDKMCSCKQCNKTLTLADIVWLEDLGKQIERSMDVNLKSWLHNGIKTEKRTDWTNEYMGQFVQVDLCLT